MVIAVVAMGMVQVAVHEIVRVVAMRHRFMAAAGAVTVATLVPTAAMAGRAVARVVAIHLEAMFVDVPVVHVVQMPVVQVVRVAVVQHCGMAALRAMLMGVSFVPVVCHALSWPEGYVAGRRCKNHTAECAARPQRVPGRSGSERCSSTVPPPLRRQPILIKYYHMSRTRRFRRMAGLLACALVLFGTTGSAVLHAAAHAGAEDAGHHGSGGTTDDGCVFCAASTLAAAPTPVFAGVTTPLPEVDGPARCQESTPGSGTSASLTPPVRGPPRA
jgi:hypothetical protein